eukprot:TRINITY_DN1917_c0_g2_i1.p1 TRINITY_DN1917_c0_g2~~TRINITY_DN1917_c0_g2_i1.p1  ORF type:complete len:781 (+),score=164.57 TRINITY_DN1917_c0_g2_i1:145-2343(+)
MDSDYVLQDGPLEQSNQESTIEIHSEGNSSVLIGGSALELFGRRWHFGAEDMVVPSCCRALIHFPLFIAILVLYNTSFPEYLCQDDKRLHRYLVVAIGLYFVLAALDLTTIFSACNTQFLQPNRTIIYIIYIRIFVFFFHVVFNIVGSVLVFSTLVSCLDSEPRVKLVGQLVVLLNWCVVGLTICMVFCVYNSHGDSEIPEDRCETGLSYLFCAPCWKDSSSLTQREPDVFSVIAKTLKLLFNDLKGIVVSDVAMGLLLVRGLQDQQRKLGKKFYAISPAEARRLQQPSTVAPPEQDQGGAASIELSSIAVDVPANSAELAHRGIQPDLNPQDWARLAEARYYVSYALGAYGWPLYVFNEPSSALRLCGCCLPLEEEQVSRLVGTNCCHCSINAFLTRTQIPSSDLLHANLLTDFAQVVYYVSVDRVKKTVVIALRGTMSLQDALTDAFALPETLEKYGISGVAHAGMTRAAAWVMDDIKQKGIMETFLKDNPEYGVRVVGHSLGAGTASLLALFLQQQYPSLQCYAYASPLLFDYKLAKRCKSFITSVVYADDVICRLSLMSLRKLKDQMKWCFNQCPPAKWKVFLSSLEKLDLYSQHHSLFDFSKPLPSDEDEKSSKEMPGDVSSDEEDNKEHALPPVHSIALALEHGPHHWTELYLPGRIFHLVRDETELPASVCGNVKCCGQAPPPRSFVYPASQHGFQELMITSRMMTDHMPKEYAENLYAIKFPNA